MEIPFSNFMLKRGDCRISVNAHCVDSWCLAYHTVGGDGRVDNTRLFCISPLPIQRRNLHREIAKKVGRG